MEKIIQRLQIFIESKGGVSVVAEKLDKHPNKFYVMFRGETKPNSATIHELKVNFPDLDLNWLYTGVGGFDGLSKIEIPLSEIEKENQRLKFELEVKGETIKKLQKENQSKDNIINNYGRVIEMIPKNANFPLADEDARWDNSFNEANRIGFKQRNVSALSVKNIMFIHNLSA
jgi:hypothetical protein